MALRFVDLDDHNYLLHPRCDAALLLQARNFDLAKWPERCDIAYHGSAPRCFHFFRLRIHADVEIWSDPGTKHRKQGSIYRSRSLLWHRFAHRIPPRF